MDQKRIDALLKARGEQSDATRSDAVALIRASGRMTARERMHALLDPGSQVEYGSIAAKTREGVWVPEAGGVDFVGSVDGQAVIASSTDYSDHGGGYGAGKLTRLFALAHDQRWPLVFFVDGGGSRARHPRSGMGHIELSGPVGRFGLFDGMAELSGWIPTIAIVSGPSFAGHASLAAFSDFLIATRGSSIGMGGPPMVEAALGVRLTPSELAGVAMHERLGGIDLLVGFVELPELPMKSISGVVHEDVHGVAEILHPVEDGVGGVALLEIHRNDVNGDAEGGQLFAQLQQVFFSTRDQHEIVLVAGELPCQFQADARRGAGDKRHVSHIGAPSRPDFSPS